MRSSTLIVGILFLAAAILLIGNLFAPPLVQNIAESIGRQRAGHAIVPDEVKEKWEREGKPNPNKR